MKAKLGSIAVFYSVMCVLTMSHIGCAHDGAIQADVGVRINSEDVRLSLWRLVFAVKSAIMRVDEYPPIQNEVFTTWFIESSSGVDHGRFGACYLDETAGVFRDVFEKNLVMIVDRGCLVGFGSKGPNREWDDTLGDDICFFFKEIGLVPKRPGEAYFGD